MPLESLSIAPQQVLKSAVSGAMGFAGTIADAAVACAAAWYMLTDRLRLMLGLELIVPSAIRKDVIAGVCEAKTELAMYLRGQSIIAFCVGILSAIGLWAIGIPDSIPLGLTAGILNMVPYLGPVIACIPVGALALTQGLMPLVLSIAVLIAVQQIDGLILSPRIVGSSTGFSPPVVLISIFSFGAVWGIAGMLAALPVMILIRTSVRVFVESRHNY